MATRTPVPSSRERAAGASYAGPAAPAPLAAAAGDGLGGRLIRLLRDLDPRTIRCGEPLRPVWVLNAVGLVKQLAVLVMSISFLTVFLELDVSAQAFRTIAVVTGVSSTLFAIAVAFVADRVPRVRVLAVGAVLFALVTLVAGWQPVMWSFVLVTVGHQMLGGLAVALPIDQSLMSDYFPPEVRGRVFAFSGSVALLGQVVLAVLAGAVLRHLHWTAGLLLTGALVLAASALYLVLPEPRRGRFDKLALGASEEVADRHQARVSLGEAIRTVGAVGTLRRICLANAFLSATGVVLLPVLLLAQAQAVGADPLLIGLVIAGQRLCTLVGLEIGGLVADRVVAERPGAILPATGWLFLLNLGVLAVFAVVRDPWVVVPLGLVQSLVSQVPTVSQSALTSLVTPARVRTFGIAVPQLYGLLGMVLVLPFAAAAGSTQALLLSAVAAGLPGVLVLLTARVDVERDITAARLAVVAEEVAAGPGDALLVCRGVTVHYDGVQVLFGVDLDVPRGQVLALLGTNGAGKSTLLRAISGLTPASGGAVFLGGREVTRAPAHELARAGVVQVPGGRGVFPELTVADNLALATWSLEGRTSGTSPAGDPEGAPGGGPDARVEAALQAFPRLRERLLAPAGSLSGGEQQMLAIAQAMVMRPRLLLVDELSLGLAPRVVAELVLALERLREAGTTVVLVEQSVDLALSIADRAVFMEKGEVRYDGSAEGLRSRPELLRAAYLRGGAVARQRRPEPADPAPVLEVDGVSVAFGGVQALSSVSLQVRRSEVVGLVGPNGAGKTTLFDAVCGFVPSTGAVAIGGRDVSAADPEARSRAGLARSFQDAALFPGLTVLEQLALCLRRGQAPGRDALLAAAWAPQARRAERALRSEASDWLALVGLADHADLVPTELSTGQRRVLDLACMAVQRPAVLLMDEPSSGIAQADAEQLAPVIDGIRRDVGCGIVLIEHDMRLLAAVADRLVGLVLGEVVVSGSLDDVTSDERMVAAYLGATPTPTRGVS